ncbi:TPA: hypothetical protein I8V91_001253 [Corynebacterium striatum]|nr:hypothetical protein [Corynebacterium striatum]HAT1242642.1 hypothetical protein [Corynebacterium striatum]HAT1253387.1 hypothetical protein [Corynebacterium striatum]HAT1266148.1 hypothetical protein [Corynebacterium striatum]HAT1318100.1 hypothetical protein [Corynebacterium striatum]
MAEIDERTGGPEEGADATAEVAKPVDTPHTVAQARALNEPSIKDLFITSVPLSLAFALSSSDLPHYPGQYVLVGICIVLAVAAGINVVRKKPKLIQATPEEFKSGDYSSLAYIGPFLPIALPPVLWGMDDLGLLPDVAVSPILLSVVKAIYLVPAFSLGAWASLNGPYRVGRRRIRKTLESTSLEGITVTTLDAVTKHADIISCLVAAGAVEGNMVTAARLSKLLGVTPELEERLRELEKVGVVKLRGVRHSDNTRTWDVTLTELGVRSMYEARRR